MLTTGVAVVSDGYVLPWALSLSFASAGTGIFIKKIGKYLTSLLPCIFFARQCALYFHARCMFVFGAPKSALPSRWSPDRYPLLHSVPFLHF
jgi:hypothetical protein